MSSEDVIWTCERCRKQVRPGNVQIVGVDEGVTNQQLIDGLTTTGEKPPYCQDKQDNCWSCIVQNNRELLEFIRSKVGVELYPTELAVEKLEEFGEEIWSLYDQRHRQHWLYGSNSGGYGAWSSSLTHFLTQSGSISFDGSPDEQWPLETGTESERWAVPIAHCEIALLVWDIPNWEIHLWPRCRGCGTPDLIDYGADLDDIVSRSVTCETCADLIEEAECCLHTDTGEGLKLLSEAIEQFKPGDRIAAARLWGPQNVRRLREALQLLLIEEARRA